MTCDPNAATDASPSGQVNAITTTRKETQHMEKKRIIGNDFRLEGISMYLWVCFSDDFGKPSICRSDDCLLIKDMKKENVKKGR